MPVVIIRNDHKSKAWKEALLKADPELHAAIVSQRRVALGHYTLDLAHRQQR